MADLEQDLEVCDSGRQPQDLLPAGGRRHACQGAQQAIDVAAHCAHEAPAGLATWYKPAGADESTTIGTRAVFTPRRSPAMASRRGASVRSRVVLATGWGAAIDSAEARAKGVDAVIAKPYRPVDLEAVLARLTQPVDQRDAA